MANETRLHQPTQSPAEKEVYIDKSGRKAIRIVTIRGMERAYVYSGMPITYKVCRLRRGGCKFNPKKTMAQDDVT